LSFSVKSCISASAKKYRREKKANRSGPNPDTRLGVKFAEAQALLQRQARSREMPSAASDTIGGIYFRSAFAGVISTGDTGI
jgi:hypothetical protein